MTKHRYSWLMVLLVGCNTDETTDPGIDDPNDPAGGWSGNGLYACFGSQGDLGAGDSAAEAEGLNGGTWSDNGTLVLDGENGDWSIANGTLTLSLDCTDPDCGPFDYERDATLECGL